MSPDDFYPINNATLVRLKDIRAVMQGSYRDQLVNSVPVGKGFTIIVRFSDDSPSMHCTYESEAERDVDYGRLVAALRGTEKC